MPRIENVIRDDVKNHVWDVPVPEKILASAPQRPVAAPPTRVARVWNGVRWVLAGSIYLVGRVTARFA